VAAVLVLGPLALGLEPEGWGRLLALSARGWTGLLLLAVLQYCVSMVLFLTVLTRLDATQAAVSNYLIPVFGIVLAWLILDERLPPAALVGGALVLGSTLLVTVWEDRRTARRNAYAERSSR
jgi:drug/metabolite transporter (DMT)-like permease